MKMKRLCPNLFFPMLCASLLLGMFEAALSPNAHAAEVNVPDANLATALRDELELEPADPITDAALADLRGDVYFSSWGIADLTGLEFATNVTGLDLSSNQLTSLGQLSGLSNLRRLSVASNQLTSLSGLSGLNLTELDASSNQLSSIGSLPGTLIRLGLQSNQISSVSDLSSLTSLEELGLSTNQISGIGALSGLSSLQQLGLASNNLTSISGLPSGIVALTFSSNQVSDIGPLSGLSSLKFVGFSDNQVSSISVLSGLGSLESVVMSSNQITDLSPLVNNSGLGSGDDVDVSSNPLSAASLNEHIPALQARGVSVTFTDSNVPVEFAAFQTESLGEGVRLGWQTASETSNLGFHVYRSSSQEGKYSRITLEMIAGSGTDAGDQLYEFVDETAEAGTTYWYRIQDIAFDGNAQLSEPIEAYVEPLVSYQGKLVTLWAKLKR